MLYSAASFPAKIPYGNYTFVEPDFSVKFPIFRCCAEHNNNNKQQQQQPQHSTASFSDKSNRLGQDADGGVGISSSNTDRRHTYESLINSNNENHNNSIIGNNGKDDGYSPYFPEDDDFLLHNKNDDFSSSAMDVVEVVHHQPPSKQPTPTSQQQRQPREVIELTRQPPPIQQQQQTVQPVQRSFHQQPYVYQPQPMQSQQIFQHQQPVHQPLQEIIPLGPGPSKKSLPPTPPIHAQQQPQQQHYRQQEIIELVLQPPAPPTPRLVPPKLEGQTGAAGSSAMMDVDMDAIDAMDDFVLDEPLAKISDRLSFLRPNLVLDVVPKSSQNLKKVMCQLRAIHPRGAGIIFCMSKYDCDNIAEQVGNDARPFHRDLTDSARKDILRRWIKGDVLILCATNAFGKSVDKPDVRFVVHHTMPQSLQLYEQQCALAGRDDQQAHCVLLYSFQDHLRVTRLLAEDVPKPTAQMLEQKEQALKDLMAYCENVVECRRAYLANCFGENFNENRCFATGNPCTLCETGTAQRYKLYDFTEEAFAVFRSVGPLRNSVLNYVADLFRGQMTKKTVKKAVEDSNHGRLPLFGMGEGMLELDAQRFLHKLVIENFIGLELFTTKHGTVYGHVRLGKRGAEWLRRYNNKPDNVPRDERIYFHIAEHREKRKSSSKSLEDLGASTSTLIAVAGSSNSKRVRKS